MIHSGLPLMTFLVTLALVPSQWEAVVRLEAKATAYTLEAGIIFHSIFIGVTLGSTTGVETVRSLMIALMFHQGNEVRGSSATASRARMDVLCVIVTTGSHSCQHQTVCVSHPELQQHTVLLYIPAAAPSTRAAPCRTMQPPGLVCLMYQAGPLAERAVMSTSPSQA